VFQLGGVAVIVSFNGGCLAGFFQIFVFNFGARSTQFQYCFFQDTRHLAKFSVVFRSSHQKHKPRWSSMIGVWPAHAREPFAFWCA